MSGEGVLEVEVKCAVWGGNETVRQFLVFRLEPLVAAEEAEVDREMKEIEAVRAT